MSLLRAGKRKNKRAMLARRMICFVCAELHEVVGFIGINIDDYAEDDAKYEPEQCMK